MERIVPLMAFVTVTEIQEFIVKVGILGAAFCFFVWRDWRREQENKKERDKNQDFMQDTLICLITENRSALDRNTEVIEKNNELLRKMIETRT